MKGWAIFFLALAVVVVLWPKIKKWLQRKAQEKTEDYLRQAMGLPPRPGSKRERKERKRQSEAYDPTGGFRRGGSQRRHRNVEDGHGARMMKEVAEDVEFTETKEYSEEKDPDKATRTPEIKMEEQVSDAVWTEVKEGDARKKR